jgi:hypothetical protein
MRMLHPQIRWLRRFIRGRRLDRNPLRRASDRTETVVLAGLMTALLAGAPFAALAGGNLAHDSARHLQQTQLATRTSVTATTLEAMPLRSQSRGVTFTSPVVEAQWSEPDGKTVIGEIPVRFGTPAGAKERVWITTNGKLADPPLTDDQVASLTTLGQVLSAITVLAVLSLTWALARKELDRRRYAAWDADWQATDSHGRQRK